MGREREREGLDVVAQRVLGRALENHEIDEGRIDLCVVEWGWGEGLACCK